MRERQTTNGLPTDADGFQRLPTPCQRFFRRAADTLPTDFQRPSPPPTP